MAKRRILLLRNEWVRSDLLILTCSCRLDPAVRLAFKNNENKHPPRKPPKKAQTEKPSYFEGMHRSFILYLSFLLRSSSTMEIVQKCESSLGFGLIVTKALMPILWNWCYDTHVHALIPTSIGSAQVEILNPSVTQCSDICIQNMFFFHSFNVGNGGILTSTESTHMLSVKTIASFERGCPRKWNN